MFGMCYTREKKISCQKKECDRRSLVNIITQNTRTYTVLLYDTSKFTTIYVHTAFIRRHK